MDPFPHLLRHKILQNVVNVVVPLGHVDNQNLVCPLGIVLRRHRDCALHKVQNLQAHFLRGEAPVVLDHRHLCPVLRRHDLPRVFRVPDVVPEEDVRVDPALFQPLDIHMTGPLPVGVQAVLVLQVDAVRVVLLDLVEILVGLVQNVVCAVLAPPLDVPQPLRLCPGAITIDGGEDVLGHPRVLGGDLRSRRILQDVVRSCVRLSQKHTVADQQHGEQLDNEREARVEEPRVHLRDDEGRHGAALWRLGCGFDRTVVQNGLRFRRACGRFFLPLARRLLNPEAPAVPAELQILRLWHSDAIVVAIGASFSLREPGGRIDRRAGPTCAASGALYPPERRSGPGAAFARTRVRGRSY
mmetsp:Transcript_14884/g.56422  ORF Transcript_14884/g.56422 Transcript_14884/m.56422 type:complete len:355 (+) Transcript_14884:2796-3860(+)